MRLVTLGRRACRKARYLLEKPYTWFQTREEGLGTRAPLDHAERCVALGLRHYLEGQDLTIYDIGASYGTYARAMAKLSQVGRVVAFEPIPDVFGQLKDSTAALPNVRCLNLALGDTNGPATFHQNDFSYSSSMLPMENLHKELFPQTVHSREITIQVARLDDVVREQDLPRPDFIKMDVQGFEDRVIAGGEATVRQARHIMLEMSLQRLYKGSPLFDDTYRLVRDLGYRLIGVADGVHGVNGRLVQIDAVFEREGTP